MTLRKKLIILLIAFPFSLFCFSAESNLNLSDFLLTQMLERLRTNSSDKSIEQTTPLNLEECLKLTLERSGRLQIAKEEYKLSILNYFHARRDLFPKLGVKYEEIDGTTTGEDFKGKGSKLEMQYPLYTSGRIRNTFKQSRLNLEIAKLKHDQVVMEVLTETEKAYYVFTEALNRLKTSEQVKSLCQEAFDVEQKRFDQKLTREIDWMETQILYREICQKIQEAENDALLAEFSLRQVLDQYQGPLKILLFEKCSPFNTAPANLLNLALDKRPDIKLNRLLEQVNRFNRDIAKSEGRLQINLDGYTGRRAENFKSEKLDYENEYYLGVTGSIPLGKNTLETQIIDQDTVPSAGQTTSTQFTSQSVKLNLLDNKFDSSRLENLIKYYKAIEDSEKVKKAAIFEMAKTYLDTLKAWEHYSLSFEKAALEQKRTEYQKLALSKNEAGINEYLKALSSSYEAKVQLSKAVSGYCSAAADFNRALGMPGWFRPDTGTEGKDFTEVLLPSTQEETSFWKGLFSNPYERDARYPDKSYEDIKFTTVTEDGFLPYLTQKTKHIDPIEEKEKNLIQKPWWKFRGNE